MNPSLRILLPKLVSALKASLPPDPEVLGFFWRQDLEVLPEVLDTLKDPQLVNAPALADAMASALFFGQHDRALMLSRELCEDPQSPWSGIETRSKVATQILYRLANLNEEQAQWVMEQSQQGNLCLDKEALESQGLAVFLNTRLLKWGLSEFPDLIEKFVIKSPGLSENLLLKAAQQSEEALVQSIQMLPKEVERPYVLKRVFVQCVEKGDIKAMERVLIHMPENWTLEPAWYCGADFSSMARTARAYPQVRAALERGLAVPLNEEYFCPDQESIQQMHEAGVPLERLRTTKGDTMAHLAARHFSGGMTLLWWATQHTELMEMANDAGQTPLDIWKETEGYNFADIQDMIAAVRVDQQAQQLEGQSGLAPAKKKAWRI